MSDASFEKEPIAPGRLVTGDLKPVGKRPAPGRVTLTSDLEDGLVPPSRTAGQEEGAVLPSPLRGKFETSLGRDLSAVRVHTNDAAHNLARHHGARAFALGNDIYFAKGQYRPGTVDGDHLIAHEVAHTQQQQGATASSGKPTLAATTAKTTPGDRAETNADKVALAMLHGKPAKLTTESAAIARKGENESIDVPAEAAHAPAGSSGQSGGETKPDEQVNLSAEFAGAEEIPGTEPIAPPHNLDAGLAGLKGKAGAEGDVGDGKLDAKADGNGADGGTPADDKTGGGGAAGGDPAGGGAAGGAPASPELQAAVAGAQNDAKEASAAAENDGNQFKADIATQRDRFANQQEALAHESLKTMTAPDKRRTLVEMGMAEKDVAKLKDAELDALIEGRLATENRKATIMGMTPEELAALPASRKKQHLVDLGIDKGDLDKIGDQKSAQAFDDVMRVAHVPGQHKVKIKIKGGLFGKSWNVTVNCDAQGNTDFDVQKEGGFFSKLFGWIKLALPIILTVLAPVTGGASLIALAVYQTIVAIKTGNWLGAIIGIAGAFVGLGALAAIKNGVSGLAQGLTKVAGVATKIKQAAETAHAALLAAKAKNAGSLLGALASGAATFAQWAGNAADKFATTMTSWSERLKKWAGIVSGAEKVVQGVKTGDPVGAIGGAFQSVSAATSKPDASGKETNGTSAALQRAAKVTGFVNAGRKALSAQPPDYASVADAALGIAGQLTENKRVDDAQKIVAAANRVKAAWAQRDSNPALLAEAALDLAQAIQLAKYDFDNGGEVKKDDKGNPIADPGRKEIMDRYVKANAIAKGAADIIAAASAKPRPNYTAALAAASQMIADLTENKMIDAAAVVTSKLDAWTAAVNSKNEALILQAGIAFGQSINDLRKTIEDERAKAKTEAEAKLAAGEKLPEAPTAEIPHFEETVDVIATLPTVDLALPPLATDIALPDTAPVTPLTPMSGRADTPNANYTVIQGDTLSGIAQRFKTTVSTLRNLNPQIISDRIYQGQKLDVPGADVVLKPSVTTDETFAIDPAVQTHAKLLQSASAMVKNVGSQCDAWNAEWSLGADFYVYVRELRGMVNDLQRFIDNNASDGALRSQILAVNTKLQGVHRLYDVRRGQKDFFIDFGLTVLPVVQTGCGLIISAFASPAAAAAYAGGISVIQSYFAGEGPVSTILKAGAAATFESATPFKAKEAATLIEKFLTTSANQAFQNVGSSVSDYIAFTSSHPNMTVAEKRELKQKLAAHIAVSIATAPFAGAVESTGIEIKLDGRILEDATQKALKLMVEGFDKAIEATLGPKD